MPSPNFAVDLHAASRVVDGSSAQSVYQQIKIVKLLGNVDFLDHNVAWLSEFRVDTILHFKPFGNFWIGREKPLRLVLLQISTPVLSREQLGPLLLRTWVRDIVPQIPMARKMTVASMTTSWTHLLVRNRPSLANSELRTEGLLLWSGLKFLWWRQQMQPSLADICLLWSKKKRLISRSDKNKRCSSISSQPTRRPDGIKYWKTVGFLSNFQ